MQKSTRQRIYIWLPTLLASVLVIGLLIGVNIPKIAPTATETGRGTGVSTNAMGEGKIEEILRYIEAKYVDSTDRELLVEQAINNILGELDPHSNYISLKQLRAVTEQLEGNFEGIGIEFLILEDTITVVSPISGGPSEAVGILAGDKIVEIEDSLIIGADIENNDVIERLRGEKGTQVTIGILRGDEDKVREFSITRDKIPMNSVDIGYMLDGKTGYIKINRFSATTYEEFMQNVERLVDEENMEDLVIDVRHNPGGYLQQATNLLSQLFEEKGRLLVYTQGYMVNRNEYKTTGRNFFDIGKVAVLIDEGSASASEIVAGAIQDLDRGIIVGRRSFGKGLVQEQYGLRDGSALRLTVARYYTPSGRSIQKSYEDSNEYDHDMMNRYESGELYDRNSIEVVDTTQYFTEDGRIVYGGGGITPDIFVPLDTLFFNDYYMELRQYVPQFIFPYAAEKEGQFPEDLQAFAKTFDVSDGMFDEFLEFAYEKGASENFQQLRQIEDQLATFLKARLARNLYGDKGFYSIWNQQDQVVQTAMEALRNSYQTRLQAEK